MPNRHLHRCRCRFLPAFLALLAFLVPGCTSLPPAELVRRTGGSAALFGQFQAYDAHTGRAISFAEVVRRCQRADVVFFGEEHANVTCNQLEAQLFHALMQDRRPVALAMEFLEADVQATVDAYLHRRVDEASFRKLTRQKSAYLLAHRPLIELCRRAGVPLLAANAPRELVRAYRQSEQSFGEFRAGLDPGEQRWLPARVHYLGGAYRERFIAMMAEHPGPASQPASMPASQPATMPASQPDSQPTSQAASAPESAPASEPTTQPASAPVSQPASQPAADARPPSERAPTPEQMYRAMLLWDNAMADALAQYRRTYRSRRVLLIVGVFHVDHDGGTLVEFQRRRRGDRVCTVVFRANETGRFAFDPEDRHAGDIVIYGVTPPAEPKGAPGLPPPAPAATQPAPAPTTTPAT